MDSCGRASQGTAKTSTATGSRVVVPVFLRKTLGWLTRSRLHYDRTVKVRPFEATYMLLDSDDIRHVLLANAVNYVKSENLVSDRGRQHSGRGLLTSTGDRHKKIRNALAPVFRQPSMDRFADLIVTRTDAVVDRWRDGSEIDIATVMTGLAQSILVGQLFGSDYSEEELAFVAAVRTRRLFTERSIVGSWPVRLPPTARLKQQYDRATELIERVVAEQIDDDRQREDDWISMLSAVELDDDRSHFERVRDEVLTLTSAGYETIADGLTWTLLLLADHPEIQERLHREIDLELGNGLPTAADLPRLSYLRTVLSESWRLYPPTWIFVRVPLAEDWLPSGTRVPAGAKLYICQYLMHRHPRFFPNPERFDPSRFDDAGEKPSRFVYFPFGDGRHTCIGEPLARMESSLILARMLVSFRVERVGGAPVRPYAGVTLRPKGPTPLVLRARRGAL